MYSNLYIYTSVVLCWAINRLSFKRVLPLVLLFVFYLMTIHLHQCLQIMNLAKAKISDSLTRRKLSTRKNFKKKKKTWKIKFQNRSENEYQTQIITFYHLSTSTAYLKFLGSGSSKLLMTCPCGSPQQGIVHELQIPLSYSLWKIAKWQIFSEIK